jgi:glucose-6-phosphate isomerase
LFENKRESITLTLTSVSAFAVGVLIALFERTVGLYASLININAYNQPGVEAGKKAAGAVIELQLKILKFLREANGQLLTVAEISAGIGASGEIETIFKICEHLAANSRGIQRARQTGGPLEAVYRSA